MYSSSLSTHRCIHVLQCLKQCYSLWTPRQFSSCAIFAFTSSTDGKWVPFSTLFTLVYRKKSQGAKSANMEDVQVFKCVYWEGTSRAKGRCELGYPDFVLPEIRPLLPQGLSPVSLLIPTMSTNILTLRRRSLQNIKINYFYVCKIQQKIVNTIFPAKFHVFQLLMQNYSQSKAFYK